MDGNTMAVLQAKNLLFNNSMSDWVPSSGNHYVAPAHIRESSAV